MDSNLFVIGLVVVSAIATMIGLTVERDARARAWRRIAEERRWNREQRPGVGDDPNAAEPRATPSPTTPSSRTAQP